MRFCRQESTIAVYQRLTVVANSAERVKENNFEFSAICLQESWLDENSYLSLLQLNNYTCISQPKYCSAHGGLVIYLHHRYDYHIINFGEKSNIWEGQFIDIPESNHI